MEEMAWLDEKELDSLAVLTGRKSAQKWRGMGKRMAAGGAAVTIANTGLVNSGKSSLFNALLDSFEQERFPVGAVRTTMQGDRENLCQGVDIVDTPGIDASDDDDDAAYSALMEADLIVAVHNIKTGMLNKSEYEWLKKLAGGMKGQEIGKRVVFVCTWIDERERQDGYQDAVKETKSQVFEALGEEVPFWEVSAKRYFTAHKKGKESLARASKIPQFKEFLLEKAVSAHGTAAQQRQQAFQQLCSETIGQLNSQKQRLQGYINRTEKNLQYKYAPAVRSWESILENFKSMREDINRKLNEFKECDQGEYDKLKSRLNQM